MQAYKGLYEDQLQTQYASAESYRSLTRGYSRLSADNKALRRETAAVTAVAGDAAGNAAAVIASSAELQRSAGTRSGNSERREQEQPRGISSIGGGGGGSGVEAESGAAAAAAAGSTITPVGNGSGGSVKTRGYTVTAAESAAAIATAASAVAAAAGALAEATTPASALPADEEGSAALVPPLIEEENRDSACGDAAAAAAAVERDGSRRSFGTSGVAVVKSGSRDRAAASRYGSTGTDRPSTAETLACSPFSDKADTSPSTTIGQLATATVERNGGAAGTKTGDAASADGQAPPAGCSLARQKATSRTTARVRGGDGDGGRTTTESYAFPQASAEEDEDCSFLTGIRSSSAAAAAASPKPQDGYLQAGRGRGDRKPDKRSGARSEAGGPRHGKAVPPVEPAPRWRGRSAGPGRLLTTSASWTEGVVVEAPKRSSSPVPPRRGRWGDCRVNDGTWGGGGEGGARGDGCSRIEPSSRVRPHSI